VAREHETRGQAAPDLVDHRRPFAVVTPLEGEQVHVEDVIGHVLDLQESGILLP
jgi:hypothetical protein